MISNFKLLAAVASLLLALEGSTAAPIASAAAAPLVTVHGKAWSPLECQALRITAIDACIHNVKAFNPGSPVASAVCIDSATAYAGTCVAAVDEARIPFEFGFEFMDEGGKGRERAFYYGDRRPGVFISEGARG
ncbi:hypothetical protein HDU96_010712 [Phlyctochytrium bullatum]|nr:hypothetical protein HDU96_010712 [Phlyctochytrium bullatum]